MGNSSKTTSRRHIGTHRSSSRTRLVRLRADAEAHRLVARVAKVRHVPLGELLSATRGTDDVAFARQLAMYLVHVLLSRTQDEVAALFARERSTVSHACALVEWRRDESWLETQIGWIEAGMEAAPPHRIGEGANLVA